MKVTKVFIIVTTNTRQLYIPSTLGDRNYPRKSTSPNSPYDTFNIN